MLSLEDAKVGIVGLGYVGLPLAVEFGKIMPTVGFDIKKERVEALQGGSDSTLEVEDDELAAATQLTFSTDLEALRDCNVYIVTVPTPIDRAKRPDLAPLQSASRMLGEIMKPGDVAIYESTVYPGATEEVCVPLIEEVSGMVFNKDFFVGYSPERINPGDKERRVSNILKVTSGSTPEAADFVDALYRKVITAGTYKASSLRVAEASKVIENTQRDVNISLVNELALIFNRLGIDTIEVLEAAGTKWNFLPFRPGLVGGHCIGVDPYYLTHKAQEVGYYPEVILAGRRINDNMGGYVADRILKLMNKADIKASGSHVLVMGLAFKENCPDLRNTRIVDLIEALEEYNVNVDVYDPWVNPAEAKEEYGLEMIAEPNKEYYDGIVVAAAHEQFREMGFDGVRALGKAQCVIFDVKNVLPADKVDGRL